MSYGRAPIVHDLKLFPFFFAPVEAGLKTFELRYADRDFRLNDILLLREFDKTRNLYTGKQLEKRISYIMRGPTNGLREGFVILGLIGRDRRDTREARSKAIIEQVEGILTPMAPGDRRTLKGLLIYLLHKQDSEQ